MTGSKNFGPWKRSLSKALSAKNKLGIVDGYIPRLEDSSPLKSQWDRVNDIVISCILHNVYKKISNGMNFVSSAKTIWDEFTDQFSSINGHRVYKILKIFML